jgi:hypothetical protein
MGSTTLSVAEFLNEIQTKVFRVFLIAIHLYSFALRFLFLQTHAAYYIYFFKLMHPVTYFYSLVAAWCKGDRRKT